MSQNQKKTKKKNIVMHDLVTDRDEVTDDNGDAKDAKKRRKGSPLKVIAAALLVAAVVKELRTPEEERTWHGRLFDFVPYDLRIPTLERMKAAWWNPDDEHILTPRAWGVGWSVNVGRIVKLVSDR